MGSEDDRRGLQPPSPRKAKASLNQLTRQAHEHLERGDTQKAMELFESAAEQSKTIGDSRTKISCSLNAGACLVSLGQYEKGMSFLESASRIIKSAGAASAEDSANDADVSANVTIADDLSDTQSLEMGADVFYNMGVAARGLRKHQSAITHFKSCIELYTKAGSKLRAAEGFTSLAKCHEDAGEIELEIANYTSAQRLYSEMGDCSSEAFVCVDLARAFMSLGKREECKQMLSTARMLSLRVDEPHTQGKLHAHFGMVYTSLQMFDDAIHSFERALPLIRIGRSSTAMQMEASILQNIGAAYNEKGLYSEAVIYHREAAALHNKAKNYNSEAKCLCNLAFAQTQLTNYSASAESFSKALTSASTVNNPFLQFQAAEGLGACNYHLQHYNKAIKHFNHALQVLDQIKEDTGIARERVMEKLSDAAEALEKLKQTRVRNHNSQSFENHLSQLDLSDGERDSNDGSSLVPATIRDITPRPRLQSGGSRHSLDRRGSVSPPKPLARRLSPELSPRKHGNESLPQPERGGFLPPIDVQRSPKLAARATHLSARDQPGTSGLAQSEPSRKHAILSGRKRKDKQGKLRGSALKQLDSYEEQLQTYMSSYREDPSGHSSLNSSSDSLSVGSQDSREQLGSSTFSRHATKPHHHKIALPRRLSPIPGAHEFRSQGSSTFSTSSPVIVQEGSLAIGPNAREMFTTRTHTVQSGQKRRKNRPLTEIVPRGSSEAEQPEVHQTHPPQPSRVCLLL